MSGNLQIPEPTWFVGSGNMGGAILDGWRAGGLDLSPVVVIRPSRTGVEGCRVVTSFAEAGPSPKLVVLAFKPQKLDEIAPELRQHLGAKTVVVSILAGVEAVSLRQRFPGAGAIVRAMPNLPVAVRRGITGLYTRDADGQTQSEINNLFAALGFTMWMADEEKLGALGAVAGAGPAYVARFIAALAKAGEKRGLTRETAATIALETVLGTAWMAATNKEDMISVAKRVASPKGTTEAGLAVLDHNDVLDQLLAFTIDAAARRGAQLAEEAKAPSLAEDARLS
ncbi:MAG TPA: pyrroline-5-carboxylate reductase dimerization domain-containing protein [Sphingomicrobium sp.]|jgi:pyrroline-5-carboxylate reductase|nr:pyrroline-5-carboxylate reductase dimerization domain-containing protein [Sphingomicrobium sp.]